MATNTPVNSNTRLVADRSEHPWLSSTAYLNSLRVRPGLRAPGLLGAYPIIGLLMLLIGLVIFGIMAIDLVTNGPLLAIDQQVADSVHSTALQSPPFLRDLMIFGFYLGEHGIILIGALLLIYFVVKRFWAEASMVVIAWAGEGSLWLYLSAYFNRPRPAFDAAVWHTMHSPGFPSGHSLSSVMCFGLLAYLIVPTLRNAFGKAVIIIVAIAIMLYIGYSRIFVGDHYLTDVLGGYRLGIAWSGLVYTAVERFARYRRWRTAQHKSGSMAPPAAAG